MSGQGEKGEGLGCGTGLGIGASCAQQPKRGQIEGKRRAPTQREENFTRKFFGIYIAPGLA